MVRRKSQIRRGFTLIELVAVIAILSIVAVIDVSRIEGVATRAKIASAEHDLVVLRDAFISSETGYFRDMGGIPGFSRGYLRLANLMISTNLYGSISGDPAYLSGFRVDDPAMGSNPVGCAAPAVFTRWDAEGDRGWRGPYVSSWASSRPSRTCDSPTT